MNVEARITNVEEFLIYSFFILNSFFILVSTFLIPILASNI